MSLEETSRALAFNNIGWNYIERHTIKRFYTQSLEGANQATDNTCLHIFSCLPCLDRIAFHRASGAVRIRAYSQPLS